MNTFGAPKALEIKNLVKSFPGGKGQADKVAVKGLDLSVNPGTFYALLGPNGAGKTTSLRIVSGLLNPTEGQVLVYGIDVQKDPIAARRIMAWVPDEPLLYDKLTPLEQLEFVAGLWELEPGLAKERAEFWLKKLELWDDRNKLQETFSRGMKQKAQLACALLHDPKLMILDEPLTGLDATIARQVKDILKDRVAQGGTVILTTHILEVAERLADRIGIITKGQLKVEGTLEDLRVLGGAGRSLEDLFLDMVAQSPEERAALLEPQA